MATRFLLLVLLIGFSAARMADLPDHQERVHPPEFTFLRLVYSGADWTASTWHVDYPKADQQFLYGLRKLTDFGFVSTEHLALPLSDPELFKFPFLYAVEVGHMRLSDKEASQLREYLLRGGFLVVDDFHGEYEWQNFYRQMKKVFPEYEPIELTIDHPIFHCYYDIKELIQVPGLQFVYSGRTWEKGGYQAHYRGIQDEKGRLMVMINYNVDLGDAWEWAEVQAYPRKYANLAFQLGINYIIYAMTH
ncbi:MAG: DUF4159 domain-containing protein [Acidobacteria bacterium]|nr:DUF4159 domain-containing protein [Acidobacteriota bacterium]